jgi:hypothetical protein
MAIFRGGLCPDAYGDCDGRMSCDGAVSDVGTGQARERLEGLTERHTIVLGLGPGFNDMLESSCHTYWTTECKTPSCGDLLLAYIGPCVGNRVYYLRQCRPFEATCPECKKTYTYAHPDVGWKNIDRGPIGFVKNRAFLGAIRPQAD